MQLLGSFFIDEGTCLRPAKLAVSLRFENVVKRVRKLFLEKFQKNSNEPSEISSLYQWEE